MKKTFAILLISTIFTQSRAQIQVKVANGILQGILDTAKGIRMFKGVPFATPPAGNLRWKEPQPMQNWTGVRMADKFGNRPMQKFIYSDMNFRSPGVSEDCLYLNVWTPAKDAKARLPVLVYFYGGGFTAGASDEYRYDGESMATKGRVTVTVNYRLGVFGFLAHPELTKESPNQASGNYGFLDQNAALRWVQKNIAAFGGDPKKITIGGESAGSGSVFAQMASPLSKNIIAGAIGESGAAIKPTMTPIPLAVAEHNGQIFQARVNAKSLADLRAIPADELLADMYKPGAIQTPSTIDNYFFTDVPAFVFAAGQQAHVPLLVGWNSAEGSFQNVMGPNPINVDNYIKAIKKMYGTDADEVLKLYPGTNDEEILKSATALASDRSIVYSTWKWADLQVQTGGHPVYRYVFSRIRPAMPAQVVKLPLPIGASHSSEIEYALGNLSTNKVYNWTPDDYKVSETMENYFANFIKTGNPNSNGLPQWPAITKGSPVNYMSIDINTQAVTETLLDRYLFLDKWYSKH